MAKLTYKDNTDVEGIIQTDEYIQQDSLSADVKDEDWEDITDWNNVVLGTYTVEESPAGQLHLLSGDAGGTNSYAGKNKTYGLLQNNYACTIQLLVKFDVLAGGFDGTTGTFDCFGIQTLNGTYNRTIMISLDSVWLYDSSNAYVRQFNYTFNTTSWWTIRVIWYEDEFIMYVRNGSGAWVRAGTGNDADPNVNSNGLMRFWVLNYPASPATTEAHVDYIKVSSGAHFPK